MVDPVTGAGAWLPAGPRGSAVSHPQAVRAVSWSRSALDVSTCNLHLHCSLSRGGGQGSETRQALAVLLSNSGNPAANSVHGALN